MGDVQTQFIETLGRRKTASARVRLTSAGKTDIFVNEKRLHEYFPTEEMQSLVKSPFLDVKEGKFNVSVRVRGGGIHSQAEAVQHGIAQALLKFDRTLRGALKEKGLLTRDARIKERRKFGLKKARRAPQWSKR
jgi:small subunit ribosomal protein S9